MLIALLLGFAFGWVGSIPVAGPIAALVVTRGIQGRFRSGAFIALGAALAEAGYACLAFWGFSTLLTRYPIVMPISRAAAAGVLAVLGVMFLRQREETPASERELKDEAWASFALGAWISLVNPTLIATWTAVVTAVYSSELVELSGWMAVPFALGVCLGIAGWFLTLLGLIRRYRGRFSPKVLARLVRIIGAGLLGLAGWFGWRFVQYFFG